GGFKKTLTRWAAITERRFPIGLERSQVVAFKPVTKPALRLLESALSRRVILLYSWAEIWLNHRKRR
ncbi:MAG: hypothetical protein ACLQM8_14595, partial [Limisphaerales bacterium]